MPVSTKNENPKFPTPVNHTCNEIGEAMHDAWALNTISQTIAILHIIMIM